MVDKRTFKQPTKKRKWEAGSDVYDYWLVLLHYQ